VLSSCDICLKAKQKREPFKGTLPKGKRVLEILHTDLMGPFSEPTFDGKRYVHVILDDYTHYVEAHLLTCKSEASDSLKRFILRAENYHEVKTKTVRFDGGTEWFKCKTWLESRGIIAETTPPYSPQVNGRVEVMNYNLCCRMRALMLDSGVPNKLWGEAVKTAAFLINRSPTITDKTPIENWTGKRPDLKDLKLFGCKAYVKTLTYVNKLQPRSKPLTFVGYALGGYLLYDENKNKTIVSRDVKFVENEIKPHEKTLSINEIDDYFSRVISTEKEDVEETPDPDTL